MEDSERIEKGNVLAKAIIEILGAPKEHIENSLKMYVEKLKKENGYEIVREDYTEGEKQNELFSAFVELDIWFDSAGNLLDFCIDSMPSSVEVIKPTDIKVKAADLSGILNDLQAKLHQSEMAIKTFKARQDLMDKNAFGIIKNFMLHITKESPKTLKELSDKMGIPEQNLKAFVNKLVHEKELTEKEGKYGRPGKQ